MKKIITALDNSEINQALADNYEIVCKDISYKEGILEQIEQNKKVDIVIFDERLDGEIELNSLIKKIKEKIKKIEIIIITENKKEIVENTKRYKKIKIYEAKKIKIKKLINLINEVEEKKEDKKEVKKEQLNFVDNKNIIIFSGARGVGKTITSMIFSILTKKENILIEINEEENYDIKIILNNKRNKIDFYSENNLNKIKSIINKKENKNIIIDLGNQTKDEVKESILKNSKKIIILLEPNIIGIKNCKKIINKYLEKYKIEKNNIYLLINKKNQNSIDKKIIKNIFRDFKILEEIKYNYKYDKYMNNEFRNIKISMSKKEKEKFNHIIKGNF